MAVKEPRPVRIFIAANGESEKAKALLSHAYREIFSDSGFEPAPQFYPGGREVETCDEARKLLLAGVEVGEPYCRRKLSYDALVISENRKVNGYFLAAMLDFAPTMKPREIAVIDSHDRAMREAVGAYNVHDMPSALAFARKLRDRLEMGSGRSV